MDYYRRQHQAQFPYAAVQTSGMFQADNTSYDNGLATAEFSCYTSYGYYSFSDPEPDRLRCSETYQYNNFDVANRLHPELPEFRPQIDYQEMSCYPSSEKMYSEHGKWGPSFINRRNYNWQPRRRSHLDDIYFPNYDTDNDSADNRASCSENRPFRRYQDYSPRGMSVLHKVNNKYRWGRRKNRTRIFNDKLKSNNTDGDKLVDKQPSERVDSPANVTDVIETTEVKDKQSLEVKSVPCTPKSTEMSFKETETTSLETKSGVDVRENNDSNAEEQLMSTTDNSSNSCSSEVYLTDEDKSCLLSNGFVDSRVLELNINSSVKESTVSPKRRKLDTINFKQILNNLSGILQEDGQFKSDTDTKQTDQSNTMSGNDLLELLQSSPSCSGGTLMEELDTKSNSRRMYSKSSANSAKVLKQIDKPKHKDKITKPENKANDKHLYFPTLANYSIPKLTVTRKKGFSDTNELYLDRMHTLFGSDYSDNDSADEFVSKTIKMTGVAKDKPESSKDKLSTSSIEKVKSNDKRKVDQKHFKPSKYSMELKKIDKRRHSLEITRSGFKDLSKAKIVDKLSMGKNGDRRTPKIQECESKAPHQIKLMDKFSTGKSNNISSPKFPESELKSSGKAKLVDNNSTGKNEGRRSPKIRKSEMKDPKQAKLVDKQSSAKKISESGLKVPDQAKLVDKHSTTQNEGRGLPKIQESELEDSKQATLSDRHSAGKNEDSRSIKMQESALKDPSYSKHAAGHIEDRGMSKIQELESKVPSQAKLVDKHSMGHTEDRISSMIQESELKDVKQAKLVDKNCTGKNEDRRSIRMQDSESKDTSRAELVKNHYTGYVEHRGMPNIQQSELRVPNQDKLLDKHSTEQKEGRGSSPKTQESELKGLKLAEKHFVGKNEVSRSIKMQESESKLVNKHPTEHVQDKKTPMIQESGFKLPNQVKLMEKKSMEQNDNIRSPKLRESEIKASDSEPNDNRKPPRIQESELKAQTHEKFVDKHSTYHNEDRRSPNIQESELKASEKVMLVENHSTLQNEGGRSPNIQESELKTSEQPKLVAEHLTGPSEDRKSPNIQESELKASSEQAKLAAKHSTGQITGRRLHKIPESDLKVVSQVELVEKRSTKKNILPESEQEALAQIKLVDKHSSEPNDDGRSPKAQESEMRAPTQAYLVHKHSRNEDKRSPKITELKASDQAMLLHNNSTVKNQDGGRTDYKIITSQEKMAQKRCNKRRRSSAEDITTTSKKIFTKEPILKKIGNIADTDIKQNNKNRSDMLEKSENNKTNNIPSDSIKEISSEKYKATKTDDVGPRSLADNKTEQSSKVVSSSSSTVLYPKQYLTSLLKNGVVSFEIVPFFNCSPISPFQLPLRQTISRCSIVLNDCCDEAVTLERPDIKEIIQIVVNKSIKHITEEVIEIVPNIPVIDLTDDGDSREPRQLGIFQPKLPSTSKDSSTTIETKEELLDILKEQCDKSVTPSEQITLYRSDETLNNSLEIQATSASISAAAVTSTGMVHRDVVSKEKQRKHLKIEDDSGVDTNESEEEGKITSTATNNTSSRSTFTTSSLKSATAASEGNDNIVSRPNVPNTSMAALQVNTTESHTLVTNPVNFPINTRNPYILSTNSSVPSTNITNSSRLSGDTFLSPANKPVLDVAPSSKNTDGAVPIVELPALQLIGRMCQQQADISNGSCVQDASRNNIWRNAERSPPPAYPGTMPRDVHTLPRDVHTIPRDVHTIPRDVHTMPREVHTSCNNSVQHSTTNNAQNNIPPSHNNMETYKRDFNNLGTLLLEYLLFFRNMRYAQSTYIFNLKRMCMRSPLLLANELRRFQDYYRDNMTDLRTSLKMDVEKLHLSSTMQINDVPNFLDAIEICLFQKSSLISKTSVVLWLHSLMSGDEDYHFWNSCLGCLYIYLETVVLKLRCRNQSSLPCHTDPFSIQQRNLLKNQIDQYNTICAKYHLSIMQDKTANITTDLTGNGKARKSKTNSTNSVFQKIRLPRTVPYDVCVSTASILASTLSATTSVVSSKTTPATGLNSQTLLNHSTGAANSSAHPIIRNYLSRTTNITTPPRIDSSPAHTPSSLNYSVPVAQEQLAALLSSKNTTATSSFPTYTLSVAGSSVQQSNPSVYNSPAQSASIRNYPLPTSVCSTSSLKSPTRITSAQKTPARITSSLKSPAHIPAALNTPAYITPTLSSPVHNSSEDNSRSDNSHVFKPPQVQLKFRCPSNRVQQTSSVSMSPSQYFGQSSTITQPNASDVEASPSRILQDLLGSTLANTSSTVERESLTLKNLLGSNRSYSVHSNNSENQSTTNDIVEKSPVYAPMLFSPSSYQVDEVDRGNNIETIDLTWVDDVDADHLQMEIDYFIKKEEPAEENHVVLNQEQFPVTPSPTDSGIESPPVQGEINELYTNRTCICDKRAEYICGCRQAMYCSLPCQKQDWASHKAICLKYNAKNKETNSGEQQ